MVFHHRSNVNLCLKTLEENEVEFVNIQEDKIIEGNEKITLGLVWTILHHFQLNLELSPVSEQEPQGKFLQTDNFPQKLTVLALSSVVIV